jgi:serine/threonine protein phosphatase PrpC
MSMNPNDPIHPEPSDLQSLQDRLRALDEALDAVEERADEEFLPDWDAFPIPAPPPVEPVDSEPTAPFDPVPVAEAAPFAPELPVPLAAPVLEPAESPVAEAPPAPPRRCPICDAVRVDGRAYCDDCGFMFPAHEPVAAANPRTNNPTMRLKDRYEIGEPFAERLGVTRHRGFDHGDDSGQPRPIIAVRAAATLVEPLAAELVAEPVDDDEIMPSFDEALPTSMPLTDPELARPTWPGPAWEEQLLKAADHPALPTVLDSFIEDGQEYLIESAPAGQVLWDAWDAPDATARERYGYLKQIAEGLHILHKAGAMLEGLRPDIIVVGESGQAQISDLSDLLPLPLPPDPPIRARLYTAPELIVGSDTADARADLYSFGAMLYALHVGRELTDMDFERQGRPKPFVPRFPDIHPLFGRLVAKTFCQQVEGRFPSDEAVKEDETGFTELIRVLETCGRTLDNVHLEIAAWTTTGMVRTGNEDAFALMHAAESRQDDLGESCLVLLCDGMGGYEAGEVAAAMAIQALRKNLLQQKPFAALAGQSPFPSELPGSQPEAPRPIDPDEVKKLLVAALRDANKQVYTASRTGKGRRGMGCTAEAVYVDGQNVVVGHIGDSRTYHLHEGRLIQLTRDQTLVNRLVELGQLTQEEAETHPRRNELQQALGGQPDVEPGQYKGVMKPGDWVLVCSDGVTNHVTHDELQQMLQVEATSAEMAARRLVNFVNINGATDNATVVVIRAT